MEKRLRCNASSCALISHQDGILEMRLTFGPAGDFMDAAQAFKEKAKTFEINTDRSAKGSLLVLFSKSATQDSVFADLEASGLVVTSKRIEYQNGQVTKCESLDDLVRFAFNH